MDVITLAHGSGGKLTHQLIDSIFQQYFDNEILGQKNDSALLPEVNGKIAVTTDSFVINPIFFNGGDIGKISVCGTVNDLAMSGAKPLYLTVGFIIEEGLAIEDLRKIVKSIAKTAKEAGVKIVTGDTKVVEQGNADKIYINTTGIGVVTRDIYIGGEMAEPGDKVIINGTLGDHGASIMAQRGDLDFDFSTESDCCLLNNLIEDILNTSNNVKVLRDPTRGGLATTLNEIASQSQVAIELEEEQIPIKAEVRSLCEILGVDPLYLANEGKVIVIVSEEDVEKVLEVMRKNPMGEDAQIIGTIVDSNDSNVYLKTGLGGTRILNMLAGELLPRIC
jgi:hydrogenase expression/formation protein HypE